MDENAFLWSTVDWQPAPTSCPVGAGTSLLLYLFPGLSVVGRPGLYVVETLSIMNGHSFFAAVSYLSFGEVPCVVFSSLGVTCSICQQDNNNVRRWFYSHR